MAEIIERPSHEWGREVACEKCGTKTRYDEDDLEHDGFKISGYFFNGTDVCEDRYFLTCPVCRKYAFVPDEDVPEVVRSYVAGRVAA